MWRRDKRLAEHGFAALGTPIGTAEHAQAGAWLTAIPSYGSRCRWHRPLVVTAARLSAATVRTHLVPTHPLECLSNAACAAPGRAALRQGTGRARPRPETLVECALHGVQQAISHTALGRARAVSGQRRVGCQRWTRVNRIKRQLRRRDACNLPNEEKQAALHKSAAQLDDAADAVGNMVKQLEFRSGGSLPTHFVGVRMPVHVRRRLGHLQSEILKREARLQKSAVSMEMHSGTGFGSRSRTLRCWWQSWLLTISAKRQRHCSAGRRLGEAKDLARCDGPSADAAEVAEAMEKEGEKEKEARAEDSAESEHQAPAPTSKKSGRKKKLPGEYLPHVTLFKSSQAGRGKSGQQAAKAAKQRIARVAKSLLGQGTEQIAFGSFFLEDCELLAMHHVQEDGYFEAQASARLRESSEEDATSPGEEEEEEEFQKEARQILERIPAAEADQKSPKKRKTKKKQTKKTGQKDLDSDTESEDSEGDKSEEEAPAKKSSAAKRGKLRKAAAAPAVKVSSKKKAAKKKAAPARPPSEEEEVEEEDDADGLGGQSQEDQRIDPEDGLAYTWSEFSEYYTGKYKKKVIEAYWNDCHLVPKKEVPLLLYILHLRARLQHQALTAISPMCECIHFLAHPQRPFANRLMGMYKIFVFFLASAVFSVRDKSFAPCTQVECDPNNTEAYARVLEEDGEGETPADAEPESEVEDGMEAEDGGDLQVLVVQPQHGSLKKSFKARQSPGVKLETSVFGGVDAMPATNKARKILDGRMHLKRIAEKDVSRASLSTVQYDWVQMIRGNRSYTVIFEFECSDENAKVSLPLAAIGLMPTLIADFSVAYVVSAASKLWNQTTKHWWVQANPALIFAAFSLKAVISSVLFDRHLDAVSPAIASMTAVHVALPMVSCLSSLAVLWGLQAAPGVAFISDTAQCPADLPKSLQAEFATVSCYLGPRLGMLTLTGWSMPCFIYTLANSEQCFKPASAFAQVSYLAAGYLLNILASQFLLEAVIVARVAQAHVRTTRDSLDLKPDVDKLQTFHKACVRLVDEIMPELAKISGPTLGLAACRAVMACLCVVEVARNLARWEEPRGKVIVIALSIVIDMPVGLYCLLLPASVSDECAELMEHLNNVRAQEISKEVKEQHPEQYQHQEYDSGSGEIRLTETYLNEVNRGQGLGFVLYGFKTVVDKRMILSMFAKFAAASSLLLTLLREVYSQEKEMESILLKLNSTTQRS
ncbi:unnamed protein product [Symbiodinium microadriaticum]|nr:unnamed protein product [Symbiodinium microadriaticum]